MHERKTNNAGKNISGNSFLTAIFLSYIFLSPSFLISIHEDCKVETNFVYRER